MPDLADLANAVVEKSLENLVSNHVNRAHQESAFECELCEKTIPQGRREAIKGTQHCVDCAEYLERKKV